MAFVLFFLFALLVLAFFASRRGAVLPRPRFESFQSGAGTLIRRDREDLPGLQAREGPLPAGIVHLTSLDGTETYLSLGPADSGGVSPKLLTRSDLWEIDKALQAIEDKAAQEAGRSVAARDRFFRMDDGLQVGYHQAGTTQTVFLDLGGGRTGGVLHFDSFVPLTGLFREALGRMAGDPRSDAGCDRPIDSAPAAD